MDGWTNKTNAYCPLSYEMGHNNKKNSGNTYISDEFAEHGECETPLWNVDAARQCEQLFNGVASSLCQQRSCRNFNNDMVTATAVTPATRENIQTMLR